MTQPTRLVAHALRAARRDLIELCDEPRYRLDLTATGVFGPGELGDAQAEPLPPF